MKIKKIILGIFFIVILSGCAQNSALLGPIYTFTTTGNVYQAGFSYGSDKIIVIKKDDSEFDKLVKRQIKKTRKRLNLTK